MKATIVTAGQKFSRWTVRCELQSRNSHRIFKCQCECGTVAHVFLSALRSGLSGSCGCLRRENVSTHGESWRDSKTPEYSAWVGMRARCRSSHRNYGGRGIRVCGRWDKSFPSFLSDMGRKPPRTSLDRIDNDGDYAPGNCRWATMVSQLRNTRRNVWVWHMGHRRLLLDAADAEGFNPHTAHARKRRGWPDARLFDPVNPNYSHR